MKTINMKVVTGARLTGSIRDVRDFGVIAEFEGGGTGLLHVSRLFGGSRRARDCRLKSLAVGAKVEVDVVDVQGGKVTLSELYRDEDVIAGLEPGAKVKATVASLLDFGVVVTIGDGVAAGYDAFVHASELVGGTRKARDQRLYSLKAGATLALEVLSAERDDRGDVSIKLSERLLSLRQKLTGSFAVGTKHTGTVLARREDGWVVNFGEFTGFLPDRELGKTNAGSISEGKGLKTKVLEIDENLRITLTRKDV
jgi:ribosomal protein S1